MSLFVDDQRREERLAICRACPHHIASQIPLSKQKIERCGKCGCPITNKTKFARATCPIHKW